MSELDQRAYWDKVFSERAWGMYPPENMVRLVMRHFVLKYSDTTQSNFLELGAGPGANLALMVARAGYSATALDISPVAVAKAKARFESEGLSGQFTSGSVLEIPFADATFDCIAEVECFTCLNQDQFTQAAGEVARVLRPGGIHLSITAMTKTWGEGTGRQVDSTTWDAVSEGPYAGFGSIRFATESGIRDTYAAAGFKIEELEHLTRTMENQSRQVHNWCVVARRV